VYGIVRQYGGWISVESRPGQGTTFLVLLPRVGEPSPVEEAPRVAPSTLRGTETILVVEDQEDVRTFAVEALRSYGYRVLEASLGGEALLLAESHPEPIHLMLADIVMPRMTGMELAARLEPLRPHMRVLFMSGYSDRAMDTRADGGGGDGEAEFIAKPFSPEILAAKVRSVLGIPVSRGRILVVENDQGVRGLFENVLSREGYEVSLASDGDRASRLLQRRSFHLVITEVAAPHLQGQEMIRLIRSSVSDQRILAVCAGSSSHSAKDLDVDATLLKPVNPEQLLAAVADLLAPRH
jgi:DNA-binding response OmpR family regulator